MPSVHVCFASSPLPQLPNQVPPGAQQLSLPDFLVVAHLGHLDTIGITFAAVSVGIETREFDKVKTKGGTAEKEP